MIEFGEMIGMDGGMVVDYRSVMIDLELPFADLSECRWKMLIGSGKHVGGKSAYQARDEPGSLSTCHLLRALPEP